MFTVESIPLLVNLLGLTQNTCYLRRLSLSKPTSTSSAGVSPIYLRLEKLTYITPVSIRISALTFLLAAFHHVNG